MPDDSDFAVTLPATTVRVTRIDPDANPAPFRGAARYREEGLLGRGGMGDVRLVEDRSIGREIAVKTIAAMLSDDPAMRERFLREVRIQGQLEHPSIVPVYDLGIDDTGNEYFTMRRISGRTLAMVLAALARGEQAVVAAFPRNALLGVFRQICLAVAYAHSRGVVHRDLKPANVMIGEFGEVYVLDWGLARVEHETIGDELDDMLGTPGYMAPEQISDASSVDARADVYSLGAILFEVLALEPWHARTAEVAIASTTMEQCARPAQRAPMRDIPPELDDLCAHATARELDQRLPTARALADAVERYLEGDRDVERRRAQARDHANAARIARARVVEAGSAADAVGARREALREAGRAVALDPEGSEGMRVALELMLEPPAEMPADLAKELDRAQSERIRAGIPLGLAVFVMFLVLAFALPALAGPLDWTFPLLIASAVTIAIATSTMRLRMRNLAAAWRGALVTSASIFVAIALASTYLGPMMIIPPLAVATGNALVASQLRWRVTLVLAVSSVLVPSLLEWAQLMPASYHFSGDALVVTSHVMRLPEVPIRVVTLVVSLAALVGSMLYVRRIVRVESELRRASLLQNWHLRQMALVD